MRTCREVTQLLSQASVAPVTMRERWGVRLHLWMCRSCRHFAAQMRFLRQAVRRWEAESRAGHDRLSTAACERIRRRMHEEHDD